MITNKQIDAELAALYPHKPTPLNETGKRARAVKRRASRDTITGLLLVKPIDVELRRLIRAELRKRKAKR